MELISLGKMNCVLALIIGCIGFVNGFRQGNKKRMILHVTYIIIATLIFACCELILRGYIF